MENSREAWIAHRAYEMWDQAGKPDGQDHAHWAQASAEWEEHQASRTNRQNWDEEEW